MGRPTGDHPFLGTWRIVDTEVWSADALDLLGPAHVTFDRNGLGEIVLIAIGASIDYRVIDLASPARVEFSWQGFDDSDVASGRGSAQIDPDGVLRGRFFIHQGDDSAFEARRDVQNASAGRRTPARKQRRVRGSAV